jgi:HD superfamily phosphohydrolase
MATEIEGWPVKTILSQIKELYDKEGLSSAWPGEAASVEEAINAIAERLRRRYSYRKALGVGGSGIVLRLKDGWFPTMDGALKFSRPSPATAMVLAEMLGDEIKYLAKLRHPGIVRITSHETLKGLPHFLELPYYVMDAIDGQKSHKAVYDPGFTDDMLVRLVTETAEILRYLHTHPEGPFAHLDVKCDNVVLADLGRPIMIDLGTCKRLSGEVVTTTVAVTRSYAHPELVKRLAPDPSDNNRSRGKLSRSEIKLEWDLWTFGRMILEWLGIDYDNGKPKSKAALALRVDTYLRKYLLLLSARLLADEGMPTWIINHTGLSVGFLRSFPVVSADALCDITSRIRGHSGPLNRIPELSTTVTDTIQAARNRHVLKTPRLELVLDHRLFRRLNTITQLGLVSQVYPGAKHSRREHSLGTYANTAEVIRALWNDPISPLFRQIISEQDCTDLLLCALLHDLGQFPLAHDFEEIDPALFSHTEMTRAILRGKWARRGAEQIDFPPLDDVFKAWKTTPDRIIEILDAKATSHTASPLKKLLSSIISGPIDADKLDYLFRDAEQTHLPYPFGLDTERLSRCITTVVVDQVEKGACDVLALGVYAKGKVAAEFMTFTRYAMFCQAYWHHAVRAQKAMLFRAVEALLSTHEQKKQDNLVRFLSSFYSWVFTLPESLYLREGKVPLLGLEEFKAVPEKELYLLEEGTDLAATDAAVLCWLRERLRAKDRSEEELIVRLLKRQLFKRLWVVTPDVEEARWKQIADLWDKLNRTQRNRAALLFEQAICRRAGSPVDVTAMSAETAKDLIDQKTKAQMPWLLIDIPGGRPGSEIGLYYVLETHGRRMRKDDRIVGKLQQSHLWETYAKNLRSAAGKLRIFCHPELVDTIDATVEQEKGLDDLVTVLQQVSTP